MHNLQFHTEFIGKPLVYLPTCHSTNLYADKLVTEGRLSEGAVIITDRQTAGRGQQGNTWEANDYQNLTFSIVLEPVFLPIIQQFDLSIVSALAVCEALRSYSTEDVKIKWPNDILYKKQKLCGILIENSLKKNTLEYSIVGIGVNINQTIFENPHAISLKLITGQQYLLADVLSKILTFFEKYYLKLKAGGSLELRKSYLERLFGYQEKYYYQTDVLLEGEIVGIDLQGKLLLKTNQGVQAYNFKEIALVY